MKTTKLRLWKLFFLLFLFIIGIMIGINMNKTKMDLIQNDKDNNLVLDNMQECCSFIGTDSNLSFCEARSK